MYTIRERFLVRGEGWKLQNTELPEGTSYEQAGRIASQIARSLDELYGDDHFWTVDLTSELGSFFQLFHGRLS